MSGGVDSSAAAALLHEQGYQVIGVTLKLYNAAGTAASIGGRCCSPRDIDDARAVAAHLGFPYYVLDEVEPFQNAVIDDFVAEYAAGRTPNPCVTCNERIKFGPLIAFADSIGADYLATGHYARLQMDENGAPHLQRSIDRDKDQSYFLFGVRNELFNRVWFPVGELRKEEVRAVAQRAGLPVYDKPDSNQICFVPDGDHKSFVQKHGGAGPAGLIVDENGRTLGKHQGTHHFTIGQRKGVPGVDGVRRFVVSVDRKTGTVHTGPRELLSRTQIRVRNIRWLHGSPEDGSRFLVQIRYRGRPYACAVYCEEDGARVVFDEPAEAVAPGQAAVFFLDDEVMGGGWIADVDRPAQPSPTNRLGASALRVLQRA